MLSALDFGLLSPTITRPGTTAAMASARGRVLSPNGRWLSGVRVRLADSEIGFPRYASTNAFGYYVFDGLDPGRIYVLTASSKRHRFTNPTVLLDLSNNAFGVNLVAEP